ncbi:MAG TPA: hypothetical protein VHA14_09100 [Bryobacteraceae bacterium]|nr:hypothetical protein [Bryobacteraceae bacterium]
MASGCTALAAGFIGAMGRKSPAPGLIGLTVAINKRIGLAIAAFERNGSDKNLRRFAEKVAKAQAPAAKTDKNFLE